MGAKKKKSNPVLRIVLFVAAAALIAASYAGYRYYGFIVKSNTQAVTGDFTDIFIPRNADFDKVMKELKEREVLVNEESFRWVAEQKEYPDFIKPGKYRIESGWSNNELVNHLKGGNQIPVRVTLDNVKTLDALAGKAAKQIEPDSAQLMEYLSSPEVISHYGFQLTTFISMFIPNTYEMYWSITAEEFTSRMAKEFKSFWSDERKAKARALGLSQSEVATLASIVQEETRKSDEMPKVARLYLNRLKRGMKLQADPTVKYAVGDPSLRRIYFKHLEKQSPYNTYIHKGLPPGPIALPQKQALDAVLNAPQHDYIFMCAKPDYSGYHNFSKTLAQHNRYRREYINFLRREGVR